jgi:hypothetical protein
VTSEELRVIIAAKHMYDSLYFGKPEVIMGLPNGVAMAYGALGCALDAATKDTKDIKVTLDAERLAEIVTYGDKKRSR